MGPEHRADATWMSFARLLVALVLWVVRFSLLGSSPRIPSLLILFVDALICGSHWWAGRPLEESEGAAFGSRGKASSAFIAGSTIAAIVLLRDTWFAIQGTEL
jgi:hypothetical protein